MNLHVKELWDKFTDKNPSYKGKKMPESYHFCDTKKDADELAELVRKGIKKATSTLLCFFELDNEKLPKENELFIITNFQGDAIAIIKNTKIEQMPFNQVPASFAYKEGEGDRSLEYWKKAHTQIYTRWLKEFDMEFDENMIAVLEHFEVLYAV